MCFLYFRNLTNNNDLCLITCSQCNHCVKMPQTREQNRKVLMQVLTTKLEAVDNLHMCLINKDKSAEI
ncbi:hypothetical protein EXN66_Car010001 [Channa argus]|uniref:Uncharacterized protein n=1 Tax=Channa argus TaxID=215402 RepID=A0A6G1PVM9_CHAAH|nr:hypothetical protein EXN66_Car010001 [Channa argus]